jgi:metal-sulfur cluster biosynthetic enzyme
MDPEMQKKIDETLARIKEPQSDLPIVDLGLVEKVTYSAKEKTLLLRLAIGAPRWQCPACSAINGVVKEGIVRRAREAFEAAFPELKIIIE